MGGSKMTGTITDGGPSLTVTTLDRPSGPLATRHGHHAAIATFPQVRIAPSMIIPAADPPAFSYTHPAIRAAHMLRRVTIRP
jgi:hypothetical protein